MLFTYTIIFICFISFFGLSGILGKIFGGSDYLFGVAFAQVEFLIPVIIYLAFCRKKLPTFSHLSAGQEIRSRIGLKAVSPLKLLVAVVAGFAIIPFLSFFSQLSLVGVKDVTTENAQAAAASHPFILMFFIVAVIPPFIEESLFRGIYFGTYSRAGLVPGICLSSLLFGSMHGNFNQFVYAFIAGLVFSAFVAASGSILVTFIMHLIVNGTSIFAFYAEKFGISMPDFFLVPHHDSVSQVFKYYFLPAFLGAIVLLICALILVKSGRKNSEIKAPEKSKIWNFEGIFDLVLIVGIAIMVLNMIATELM